MRTIVYCPHCGQIGNIEEGKNIPVCPKCSRAQMVDAMIPLNKWEQFTEEDKAAFRKQWRIEKTYEISREEPQDVANASGNASGTAVDPFTGADRSEYYLQKIAEETEKIHSWVRFFGVLTVIGMIAGFIIGLILARK